MYAVKHKTPHLLSNVITYRVQLYVNKILDLTSMYAFDWKRYFLDLYAHVNTIDWNKLITFDLRLMNQCSHLNEDTLNWSSIIFYPILLTPRRNPFFTTRIV